VWKSGALDLHVHKNYCPADGDAHAVSPLHVNMKKNWGVVQLVGHLTVNEDGEGSNPSAPAKFLPVEMITSELRPPRSFACTESLEGNGTAKRLVRTPGTRVADLNVSRESRYR
jgi:hypothetical protein